MHSHIKEEPPYAVVRDATILSKEIYTYSEKKGMPSLKTAYSTDSTIKMLQESLLFKDSDEKTLHGIRSKCEEIHLEKGDPVFIENEVSNHLYFIVSGSVEIVSYKEKFKQATRIRTLKTGENFSELSVLTRSNHSTSCFALEDTTLLSLNHQLFHEILYANPVIARNIVKALARLNQQLTHSHDYIEYFKEHMLKFTPEIITILPFEFLEQFGVVPLRLDYNTLMIAMKNPYNKEFFQLFRRLKPHINLRINIINESDFKRIIKMMTRHYSGFDLPEKIELHQLPHTTTSPEDLTELLKYTSFFSQLDENLTQEIIPLFKLRTFAPGEAIFKPGTPSETFYQIKEGSVELTKPLEIGGTTHVVTLEKNDSFAEISLITDSRHSLLAEAKQETQTYCLAKDNFATLFDKPIFSVTLARILATRLQELNRQIQIRYYSGEVIVGNPSLSDILPQSVIREYKILPLALQDKELTIGLVNPEEELIYVIINRYLSDYQINMFVINEADFQRVIGQLHNVAEQSSKTLLEERRPSLSTVSDRDPIRYLERNLYNGILNRASDIHFEPLENSFAIRFRIDGELRELHERIDRNFGLYVINRIKILSKLDLAEKRLPQDGNLSMRTGDLEVHARVSCVPSKLGEKIVLRLIQTRKSVIPLNMLVPDKHTIRFLRNIIRYKQGVFLITGPTGSGKTTTLYSVLSEIASVKNNVVTVEDPVELLLSWATQIQIHDKIKLTYDRVLRHILRQDPDIIMLGEIRDAHSAQFAFEAALTGHLVFATLHTNNSLDIVPRLRELGIHFSTLAAGLIGSMAQRLLPAICPDCKEKRPTRSAEQEVFKHFLNMKSPPDEVAEGKGCDKCDQTGYFDRIPIFEYWGKTTGVRDALLNEASQEELLKALRHQSFRTLHEFGLQMVLNSLTTITQVERHLFGLDLKELT